MVRTVYKYAVSMQSFSDVLLLPRGAKVIGAAIDRRLNLCILWAEVDSDAPHVLRTVYTLPTGAEIPAEAAEHVATLNAEGVIVHVFIDAEPPSCTD